MRSRSLPRLREGGEGKPQALSKRLRVPPPRFLISSIV
jgi:hypothetical protein